MPQLPHSMRRSIRKPYLKGLNEVLGKIETIDMRGLGDLLSKAHMRSSKIIKGMKEYRMFFKVLSFLAKAQGFSCQRCKGLAECQVEPLKEGSTDIYSHMNQSFCPALYPVRYLDNSSLFPLLYHLSIDQVRMWFLYWIFGAALLACSREGFYCMITFDQCLLIATKAVTEKAGNTCNDMDSHLYEHKGCGIGAGTHNSSKNKAKLWGITDPNPLAAIFSPLWAFLFICGLIIKK